MGEILKIIPTSLQNKFEKWSVFFFYFFINGLFVLKYSGENSVYYLVAYLLAILILGVFYVKINLKIVVYKYLFWILVALFFLFSLILNYYVDDTSLNVDRWDAMEIGIKAVLNNEYPYDIKDSMGRESSNLPFLIILGMPFYLIFGSVGFLQSFSFLLFSYLIFKVFHNYKLRLAGLVLLVLSPSYLWEVYVKSDLLSNFVIVISYSYLIWTRFIQYKKIKIEWVSLLTALVFLTRLSVLIPLTIILLKALYKLTFSGKFRFAGIFTLAVSGILYFFLRNAENWEVLINHNPFTIQGSKQPIALSVFLIIMAIYFSFKAKSFFDIVFSSGLILFIAVFSTFLLYLLEFGYAKVIDDSFFDLSFFNMSIPFIIVSSCYILKRNFKSYLE